VAEQRLAFFVQNPELIALAKGDLYLRKEEVQRFSAPLGYFFYRVIPDWVRGFAARGEEEGPSPSQGAEAVAELRETQSIPPASPSTAVGPPPVASELRATVIAVVTTLAELGLIQIPGAPMSAGKPALPAELHPGAAPTVVGNELAGAWTPPPRPTIEGPRSAVRRAFYDMLSRG
jgi:hypothetical protein